jgi:O-acetyl-ADP-ribose deacetylase (regulator of RNase III)
MGQPGFPLIAPRKNKCGHHGGVAYEIVRRGLTNWFRSVGYLSLGCGIRD